jgi:hypothetical protein
VLSCAISNDDLTQSKEILRKHFELDEVGELAELIDVRLKMKEIKEKW